MTQTFIHDGGGMAKLSPSITGKVWFDTYFDGCLVHHSSVNTEEVADIIIHLTDRGYYLNLHG